ncbi:MAG: HAD family hydrolase [Treponema sp.]|nr:HAD family hydrolase [Treponema sp.]
MYAGIKAVAFDIDGTLYPSWRLYVRIAPYFVRHIRFFLKYSRVRKVLHKTAPLPDFFEYQARLLAKELGCESDYAKLLIQEICYEGLKPYFFKIKTFPDVYQTLVAFKSAGLKIGIMSDFPPEQKGRLWGLRSLCDVCIGSEESGALKPSVYPFGILTKKLGVAPSEILYVGNSIKYDVRGAKGYGMKTAYLMQGFKKLFRVGCPEADISFANYRQLKNIVLN